ncbi:MAG: hypothetical protein C4288_00935 [Leptolyngbya sp. ERB_1_1]
MNCGWHRIFMRCISIVLFPTSPMVIGAQILIGIGAGLSNSIAGVVVQKSWIQCRIPIPSCDRGCSCWCILV